MRFGIILIGDELLSGKRQDKHMAFVIQALKQRGLELSWARIVGDETELLVQTFRETFALSDVIFSFGGIGGTPDDITRQCVAEALGLPIERHPEAMKMMKEKFGDGLFPNRVRMAELPAGSNLIPNPINQVPGFCLRQHYFVPGFSNMSHPMVEWVLGTYYRSAFKPEPDTETRLQILDTPESKLIQIMETVLKQNPNIKLSSLPNTQNRKEVELGLRGVRVNVEKAAEMLLFLLESKEIKFRSFPES
jgi:molybdenum cofactor synthesis domain-containing protein